MLETCAFREKWLQRLLTYNNKIYDSLKKKKQIIWKLVDVRSEVELKDKGSCIPTQQILDFVVIGKLCFQLYNFILKKFIVKTRVDKQF